MLTIKQVQQELKLSKPTVYKLIREGKLKATRIGHRWRVREEDLEHLKGG